MNVYRLYGRLIRAVVRNSGDKNFVQIGDMEPDANWALVLQGISTVVHLAAYVHKKKSEAVHEVGEFHRINVEGSINLATQAMRAGVKRFIFLSSIKVNGNKTCEKTIFLPSDLPNPKDEYGMSKAEAEKRLIEAVSRSDMELVIIRAPLVYGPSVRSNFATLISWVKSGLPLPFGRIENYRSLVAIDNLTSFIAHCIEHPKAANEVFLISDGEDVSTT